MATVPGPQPDRRFPPPGAPAERPAVPDEEERVASPPDRSDSEPGWAPEPFEPERERAEPAMPAGVP
jgi:hypothetical protein